MFILEKRGSLGASSSPPFSCRVKQGGGAPEWWDCSVHRQRFFPAVEALIITHKINFSQFALGMWVFAVGLFHCSRVWRTEPCWWWEHLLRIIVHIHKLWYSNTVLSNIKLQNDSCRKKHTELCIVWFIIHWVPQIIMQAVFYFYLFLQIKSTLKQIFSAHEYSGTWLMWLNLENLGMEECLAIKGPCPPRMFLHEPWSSLETKSKRRNSSAWEMTCSVYRMTRVSSEE